VQSEVQRARGQRDRRVLTHVRVRVFEPQMREPRETLEMRVQQVGLRRKRRNVWFGKTDTQHSF
jgi:hypothetical protein